MDKKIIAGICVVAVCLMIGITQMKMANPCWPRAAAEEDQMAYSPASKATPVTPDAVKKQTAASMDSAAAVADTNSAETDSSFAVVFMDDKKSQPSANEANGDTAAVMEQQDQSQTAQSLADSQQDGNTLVIFCAKGSVDEMKEAINKGADINSTNNFLGITPIMAAISDKDPQRALEKVKFLVKSGASLAASNDENTSPLHLAVSKEGAIGLVEFLLASGADVEAKDFKGLTPLMTVAMGSGILSPEDQTEMIKALINAKANLNSTGPNDITALFLASINASPELIKLLAENGAKIDMTDSLGRTALMVATWGNTPEAVEALLMKGADPTVKDNNGLSVLDHADKHTNLNAERIKNILKRSGAK